MTDDRTLPSDLGYWLYFWRPARIRLTLKRFLPLDHDQLIAEMVTIQRGLPCLDLRLGNDIFAPSKRSTTIGCRWDRVNSNAVPSWNETAGGWMHHNSRSGNMTAATLSLRDSKEKKTRGLCIYGLACVFKPELLSSLSHDRLFVFLRVFYRWRIVADFFER